MKVVIECKHTEVEFLTPQQIVMSAYRFIKETYGYSSVDTNREQILANELDMQYRESVLYIYDNINPNMKFKVEKIVIMDWIEYVVYDVREA